MFAAFLISFAAVAVASASSNSNTGDGHIRRNILLIVCDDLRPALQSYGDTKASTPHIDRLAAESFLFTRAYAQVSLRSRCTSIAAQS